MVIAEPEFIAITRLMVSERSEGKVRCVVVAVLVVNLGNDLLVMGLLRVVLIIMTIVEVVWLKRDVLFMIRVAAEW